MAKITIFGLAGTGKGTVCRLLCEKLGYRSFSGGDFARETARKMGLTINEIDELSRYDKSVDIERDRVIEDFGKTNDNFVVEARLGWKFIPDSYKVSFECDFEERTRRVAQREKKDIVTVQAETVQRENAIYDRFLKYYGIKNVNDPKHFDLIIDTTHITPEEIAEKIINGLKENNVF
ncbi:MAG: cytidylate kinase [Candidatus Taylorbacteria bacterium]|nr:cytidylate kinase [Candidatus Taylorbacteria bacterium]